MVRGRGFEPLRSSAQSGTPVKIGRNIVGPQIRRLRFARNLSQPAFCREMPTTRIGRWARPHWQRLKPVRDGSAILNSCCSPARLAFLCPSCFLSEFERRLGQKQIRAARCLNLAPAMIPTFWLYPLNRENLGAIGAGNQYLAARSASDRAYRSIALTQKNAWPHASGASVGREFESPLARNTNPIRPQRRSMATEADVT